MKTPQPRGLTLGWLLLVLCAGGLFATDISWRALLRISLTSRSEWFAPVPPDDPLPSEMLKTASDGAPEPASLSMSGLLHDLLFSRPETGWRLANTQSELSSAWLTQQSAPFVTATGGDPLPTAFFSGDLVTRSVSQTGPVPTAPDGGPSTTGIWISNAPGNWGTSTNWQGGVIPQGNTARARFDTLNITTNVTVTNEVARTIGEIDLGDTDGTNTYNIAGSTITFENLFDGHGTIRQMVNSGGDTISAPLLLNQDLDVTNSSANPLTLTGNITSNGPTNTSTTIAFLAGEVNVTGNLSDGAGTALGVQVLNGIVVLSGTNSYTRQTFVNGGTLLVNGDNSATTSPVFVSGTGSVLGGTGKIGGDVFLDAGTITGGTTTTVGTLTLLQDVFIASQEGGGGIYVANLSAATSDLLAISGQLFLGTNSTLNIQGNADGFTTYILATFDSHSDVFQFVSGLPANYSLVYNPTDLELVPIPEPATWIGGAFAVGAMALWRARKNVTRGRRAS